MTEPTPNRTRADAGYALCPTCAGRGSCRWCADSGRVEGERCSACVVEGACHECGGEGQVRSDHYALAAWVMRRIPESGYELCIDCGGWGPCLLCEGEALVDGNVCGLCTGARYCRFCEGSGQVRPSFYSKRGDSGSRDIAESLAHPQPRWRVSALRQIAASPRLYERMLGACEALLADREIALFMAPNAYAEVRWFAADAVAALRASLGRVSPVVIDDAMVPVMNVSTLAEAAGLTVERSAGESSIDAERRAVGRLAELGKLARARIVR